MNPSGAMNMAQMARAMNNIRTFPVMNPRTFSTSRPQEAPVAYVPPQTPIVLLPYGTYAPYMYVTPVYYQPIPQYQQQRHFSNQRNSGLDFNGQQTTNIVENNTYYYSNGANYGTAAAQRLQDDTESETESSGRLEQMSAMDIYKMIVEYSSRMPRARISWLNKLLLKVSNQAEFYKSLEIIDLYQTRLSEITPETGTLFIKAACRAGEPEIALAVLKANERVRIFPTLGGIHYLMINFSLKKDSKSVKETFEVAKVRHLQPNTRTYQILIRECVDSGMMDDALKYVEECESSNIEPNRVTYNIVMNGLRQAGKANEILALRQKMNQHNLEINDTTIKFTSIAYMMLGDSQKAVAEFLSYPQLNEKMADYCKKFFEVFQENSPQQTKYVLDLFEAVQSSGTKLPQEVISKLEEAKAGASNQ